MHPNSLRNLKPLEKGCKALPRVYSAPLELTERVAQLRACGHTFKAIGDSLDLTESQAKYLLQGSPSNPYVRGYEAPITQVLSETFKTSDLAGEKQENHLNDAISN